MTTSACPRCAEPTQPPHTTCEQCGWEHGDPLPVVAGYITVHGAILCTGCRKVAEQGDRAIHDGEDLADTEGCTRCRRLLSPGQPTTRADVAPVMLGVGW